jgi:hypothetical protein
MTLAASVALRGRMESPRPRKTPWRHQEQNVLFKRKQHHEIPHGVLGFRATGATIDDDER